MSTIRYFWLTCVFLYSLSSFAQPPSEVPPASAEAPPSVEKADSKIPKEPIHFDVKDNELKINPPVFQYDLEASKGGKLVMGGDLTFDSQSLKPSLHGDTFKIEWNQKLVGSGELSLIDRMGAEKWRQNIKGEGSWSSKYQEGDNPMPFKDGDKFRYCLKEKVGENYSAICSRWYGVETRDGALTMGALIGESTPRAIFQSEEAKLKGRRDVTVGSPVQFFASLVTGDSYEFRSEPRELVIRDMSVAEDPEKVTLIGQMPQPLNLDTEILKGESYGSLTTLIGFEKTIAVRPVFWKSQVAVKGAEVVLPGSRGGVFVYPLDISNPPKEKNRLYIERRTSRDTYKSRDKLLVSDFEGNIKTWEFDAPERLKTNRIFMEVPGDVNPHKSYLEVYRGGAGEASVRLTGLATASSQFSVFAEAHVSWWFNDIFGSPNYYLSRHRWGASAKYFTSMTKLKEVEEGDDTLTVMQADIRYRLNPGLWERDESVGLIASYETVKVGEFNLPKMGAGVFWARSMPRVFDQWFSKLPYMNYPKWVDMEFIKYVASMNSEDQLGEDFVINFHGKVLWTESFFGEAGFGMKNYYVTRTTSDAHLKLTTFYGTVGLGINF